MEDYEMFFKNKAYFLLISLIFGSFLKADLINYDTAKALAASKMPIVKEERRVDPIYETYYNIIDRALKYASVIKNFDGYSNKDIKNYDEDKVKFFMEKFQSLVQLAFEKFWDIPENKFNIKYGFYDAVSAALLHWLLADEMRGFNYNEKRDAKNLIEILSFQDYSEYFDYVYTPVYKGAPNYTFNFEHLVNNMNKRFSFGRNPSTKDILDFLALRQKGDYPENTTSIETSKIQDIYSPEQILHGTEQYLKLIKIYPEFVQLIKDYEIPIQGIERIKYYKNSTYIYYSKNILMVFVKDPKTGVHYDHLKRNFENLLKKFPQLNELGESITKKNNLGYLFNMLRIQPDNTKDIKVIRKVVSNMGNAQCNEHFDILVFNAYDDSKVIKFEGCLRYLASEVIFLYK